MSYRDIAVEACNVIDVLTDFIAISISGHRVSKKDSGKAFSLMMTASRRLRKLIEQEDRISEFMKELDE